MSHDLTVDPTATAADIHIKLQQLLHSNTLSPSNNFTQQLPTNTNADSTPSPSLSPSPSSSPSNNSTKQIITNMIAKSNSSSPASNLMDVESPHDQPGISKGYSFFSSPCLPSYFLLYSLYPFHIISLMLYTRIQMVAFGFAPFIVHVEARDYLSARFLFNSAIQAGLRSSGLLPGFHLSLLSPLAYPSFNSLMSIWCSHSLSTCL